MSGLQRMSLQYEKCDSGIDGAAAKPSQVTKQICESFCFSLFCFACFAVYKRHSTGITLYLYRRIGGPTPGVC